MEGIKNFLMDSHSNFIKNAYKTIEYCYEYNIPFLLTFRVDNTWEEIIPNELIAQTGDDKRLVVISIDNIVSTLNSNNTLKVRVRFRETDALLSFTIDLGKLNSLFIGKEISEFVLINPIYQSPISLSREERHVVCLESFEYLLEVDSSCIYNTTKEELELKVLQDKEKK